MRIVKLFHCLLHCLGIRIRKVLGPNHFENALNPGDSGRDHGSVNQAVDRANEPVTLLSRSNVPAPNQFFRARHLSILSVSDYILGRLFEAEPLLISLPEYGDRIPMLGHTSPCFFGW